MFCEDNDPLITHVVYSFVSHQPHANTVLCVFYKNHIRNQGFNASNWKNILISGHSKRRTEA